jgi:very-short-patch-repair endonuclease
VEVDGQQHGLSAAIARDAGRDEYFRLRGIRTMRFSAATVARDFEAVVATIAHTAATRTPLRTCSPPLQGEATRGKAAAGGVSPSPQRD